MFGVADDALAVVYEKGYVPLLLWGIDKVKEKRHRACNSTPLNLWPELGTSQCRTSTPIIHRHLNTSTQQFRLSGWMTPTRQDFGKDGTGAAPFGGLARPVPVLHLPKARVCPRRNPASRIGTLPVGGLYPYLVVVLEYPSICLQPVILQVFISTNSGMGRTVKRAASGRVCSVSGAVISVTSMCRAMTVSCVGIVQKRLLNGQGGFIGQFWRQWTSRECLP